MSIIVNPSVGGGGGPHASSHENGGLDEISVAGLSGLLATPQTPAGHSHAAGDLPSVTGLNGFPGGTTNFLRADGTFAAPAGGGGIIVQAREASLISIASSVTETDIFNQTIPANVMGTDKLLRLSIIGARLNNSGATEVAPVFRVYTGGTEQYDETMTALGTNAAWAPYWIQVLLGMQGAANTMYLAGMVGQGLAGGANTGIGNLAAATALGGPFGGASGTTFTQDTTVNWVLRVSWQNGTNNANVIFRRHYAVLELL